MENEQRYGFVDFNGVLNGIGREADDVNPKFAIPKLACPEKIKLLVEFALKHDVKLVFISEHRTRVSLKVIIGRCLLHCGYEGFKEFHDENRIKIRELCNAPHTDKLGSRNEEIAAYVKKYDIQHMVTFEDHHPIDNTYGIIRINSRYGLLPHHIMEAEAHFDIYPE